MRDEKINSMDNRWLITGGCGFIGTSLVRKIKDIQPNSVILILDNLSVGNKKNLSEVYTFRELNPKLTPIINSNFSLNLVVGDVRSNEICKLCCQEIDIIVHLAANTGVGSSVENPRIDMENNVSGTFNILEAARQNKVKRFIFASCSAHVGECEPPINEKTAACPVSPYGASKLAGEGYCSAYYRSFGLKTISLRFGNVYGPGSTHKSSIVAEFIRRAINGQTCEIYGNGTQTRDFIFIDDLTDAIIKAALFQAPGFQAKDIIHSEVSLPVNLNPRVLIYPWGEVFHITTNKEHTINEVSEMLKNILLGYGTDMNIKHVQPRVGDVFRNYSDTSKAKDILGWQAKTPLLGGLRNTVTWFLNNDKDQASNMIQ